MKWTNEQINQLTRLRADGEPYSKIALTMKVSKNAISGKSRRLHLDPRESPIKGGKANPNFVRTNKQHIERMARKMIGPALPIPSMADPKPVHVLPAYSAQIITPFYGIRHCQYPSGIPGTKGFRFCEAASIPSKSYCPEHYRICYVPLRHHQENAA